MNSIDVKGFCENLKATKPPYDCPVPNCGKSYKSWSGITFHMYNYDHDNPDSGHSTPGGKKIPIGRKRGKFHHRSNQRSHSPENRPVIRDTLTYAEAQRLVEVEVKGQLRRINIFEPLQLVSRDRADMKEQAAANKKPEKRQTSPAKLPEANFKVLEDYPQPAKKHVQQTGYFRYIEKSVEELDEEVEYDMDDQDYAWLNIINAMRKKDGTTGISQDTFEFIMDRFEKEAHFQSQNNGDENVPQIDEDAVCCICMDGECQNSNVILFCDMCDLAVHQECYGVPYIPEGQWLCRRCLQSPSRAVDCCLCPNKGGAFKQTEDNRWAHVICAIWIPEVIFANTVFLEPVDGIENIPSARWKLTCYICKQKSVGACIQCHKTNCYTAFHVTCAQQAGLYMKVEQVKSTTGPMSPSGLPIRKTAFCDVHTPANMKGTSMVDNSDSDGEKSAQEKARIKMRKARKILAAKRNAKPVVNIPMIPESRIDAIMKKVHSSKKQPLVKRLIAYWTLKRQSRNGVPLLRRLQSTQSVAKPHREADKLPPRAVRMPIPCVLPPFGLPPKVPRGHQSIPADPSECATALEQLKYWKRLRQDLEKARLLVELIRKREKLKREELRLYCQLTELKLNPLTFFLRRVFNELRQIDSSCVFMQPVDISEVPDYLDYIKVPMDMSTMNSKVEDFKYGSLDEFEHDLDLMISNCMSYNSNDTPFYKAALKMKEQGGAIMRAARRMYEFIGFEPGTGLLLPQRPETAVNPHNRERKVTSDSVEEFVENLEKTEKTNEDKLKILMDELDYAILEKGRKSKVSKVLRKEVLTIRKKMAKQGGSEAASFMDESSALDTERADTPIVERNPVKAELKRLPVAPLLTPSPGTVNRRTAVLFASKKLRRPSPLVKSPVTSPFPSNTVKSPSDPPTSPSKPKAEPGESSQQMGATPAVNKKRLGDSHPDLPNPKKIHIPKTPGGAQGKESFTRYRGSLTALSASELEELSLTDTEVSESESETETDPEKDNSNPTNTSTRKLRSGDDRYSVPLTALDLVWAKCRGYPWYPAMIVDPKVPSGYTFNGVPIPKPPQSVLDLQCKFNVAVFLILFFDAKRTWQWLPRDKLEPLGVDSEYDHQKLSDNRKPNIKKALMSAYEKALRHQRKIDDGDDDDDDNDDDDN